MLQRAMRTLKIFSVSIATILGFLCLTSCSDSVSKQALLRALFEEENKLYFRSAEKQKMKSVVNISVREATNDFVWGLQEFEEEYGIDGAYRVTFKNGNIVTYIISIGEIYKIPDDLKDTIGTIRPLGSSRRINVEVKGVAKARTLNSNGTETRGWWYYYYASFDGGDYSWYSTNMGVDLRFKELMRDRLR